MARKTRAQLEAIWIDGYTPTQQDFADLFESVINIDTDKAPLYKYKAYLSQSGTDAPVATVVVNTFPAELVWSYSSEGTYLVTLAGAFTEGKTFTQIDGSEGRATSSILHCTKVFGLNDVDSCYLVTGDISGTKSDGKMFSMGVSIEVYP